MTLGTQLKHTFYFHASSMDIVLICGYFAVYLFLFFNRSIKMRRRLLRGRMFALGLLFIIYSAINVYSSSVIASAAGSESAPNDLSTISPKSDDAGSNDGKVMSAFTLEKPQPTTSRTKGLLSILNICNVHVWQNYGNLTLLNFYSIQKAVLLESNEILFKKIQSPVFMCNLML